MAAVTNFYVHGKLTTGMALLFLSCIARTALIILKISSALTKENVNKKERPYRSYLTLPMVREKVSTRFKIRSRTTPDGFCFACA